MTPVDTAARSFLRAISRGELQPPVLPFGHRDDDGHLQRAIFGKARRHVHELKQLQAVDAALRFRDAAELIQIAFTECELAANDIFIDRDAAFDGDRTEDRLRPGVGRDGQLHARVGRARAFDNAHAAVWKAVVAQLGDGHVVRRKDEPLVTRLTRHDRQSRLEPVEMLGRYAIESVEDDVLHDRGFSLVDLYRDRNFVLGLVQLDVHADDFRARISAIRIKRLDAFHIAIELGAIEETLARPGKESALARREDFFQLARRHCIRAVELDRRNLYVAGLTARRRTCRDDHDREESSYQHHAA